MINKKLQNRLYDLAIALSPVYKCHRCSHIAFLLKHNKIIHIGFNKVKTHPMLKYYPYYATGIHAELDVVMKSNENDLSDYTLVVLRILKNKKLSMSKPCKSCQYIIKQYGINNCYYSDFSGKLIKL